LTQSIKTSTKNVQQWQSRCYKPGPDAVTSLHSNHSFLLCVLWKPLDTHNKTSQAQYKKQKVHNFKYSVGKIVIHQGMLLHLGRCTCSLSHPYKQRCKFCVKISGKGREEKHNKAFSVTSILYFMERQPR
jgi:hypothetical protein